MILRMPWIRTTLRHMPVRHGDLVTGFKGTFDDCRCPVNEQTSRFWHSDDEGARRVCYACFHRRWTELALLPPERHLYMREILANEIRGGSHSCQDLTPRSMLRPIESDDIDQ